MGIYNFHHKTIDSILSSSTDDPSQLFMHPRALKILAWIMGLLFAFNVLASFVSGEFIWSNLVATLALFALSLALPWMIHPAELNRVSVRQVANHFLDCREEKVDPDIFVLTSRPGYIMEGRKLLSCRIMDDGSGQIQLTLLGEKSVRIVNPEDEVFWLRPLASTPRGGSGDNGECKGRLVTLILEGDVVFYSQNKRSECTRRAINLGLIYRPGYEEGVRTTDAAISAGAAYSQDPERSRALLIGGPHARVEINKYQIILDDRAFDFQDLVNRLASVAGDRFDGVLKERLEREFREGDEVGVMRTIAGLGKDVVVGAMGSGAWAAIAKISGLG